MIRFLITLLLVLPGIFKPCEAAQADAIKLAITRMEAFVEEEWRFKVTSTGTDQSMEVFDPLKTPSWQLVSENGAEPSARRQSEYWKDKKAEMEEEESGPEFDLIDFSTLKLVRENEQVAVYVFTMNESEDGISEHLRGQIWLNKSGVFIERAEFANRKPFSPQLGVKIDSLFMSLEFAQIEKDVFVPTKMVAKVEAKMLGLKSVSENTQQVYSEYQRVVPAKPVALCHKRSHFSHNCAASVILY